MKFTYIGQFPNPVRCYTGEFVVAGDVVELNDHLSEKAKKNPYYRQVKRGRKARGDQSRNKE